MQAFAAICNQSAVIKSLFWFAPSCLQSKLLFNCFCFNLEKNSVSHNFSLSLLQRKGNEENWTMARKVVGLNPGWANTQHLKITE